MNILKVMLLALTLSVACSPAPAGASGSSSQPAQAGKKSRKAKKPAKRKAKKARCYRVGNVLRGQAAWYGGKLHGGKTASGERFDKFAMTAAHRTLPVNTVVKVTNLRTKRSVKVRINDRGPFGKKSRIIDVSEGAAGKIGMIKSGVAKVKIEIVKMPPAKPGKRGKRRGCR